ncbi:hypothetical protein ACVW1J_001104 [Serratia marcescens]
MGTHGAQRKTLALAVAGALLGTGFAMAPEAKAAGFIDDSTLTGGIYYWQRERDRKDLNPDSKDYNQYTTQPVALYRQPEPGFRVGLCLGHVRLGCRRLYRHRTG